LYAAAPRFFGLTALADQRLGGVIMWVPAGIVPLVAFHVTVMDGHGSFFERRPRSGYDGLPP
jgi:cytochrome c oxidase assembly factor CtaG